MGLDGISVNQLRITPENNSAELNVSTRFSLDATHKIVDGLSQGQKVDPDKQNEHEKPNLNNSFNSQDEQEDENNKDEPLEEVIKYDLSRNDKYLLKIEDESNSILIVEKSTQNIVQKISAEKLSNFVNYLSNSNGSIVNRKF